jgi:hypothetical protein
MTLHAAALLTAATRSPRLLAAAAALVVGAAPIAARAQIAPVGQATAAMAGIIYGIDLGGDAIGAVIGRPAPGAPEMRLPVQMDAPNPDEALARAAITPAAPAVPVAAVTTTVTTTVTPEPGTLALVAVAGAVVGVVARRRQRTLAR